MDNLDRYHSTLIHTAMENAGAVNVHDLQEIKSLIDTGKHTPTIDVSVVIPTCNRKQRLMSLLHNLAAGFCLPLEIIIVDSGEETLDAYELSLFHQVEILYLQSEKSVCIQRNIGITQARGEWIFLCDDDIEVPAEYLQQIACHVTVHPEAGAVTGLVLQKQNNDWISGYPIKSTRRLAWKFIFQQSIWGEIKCPKNILVNKLKKFYDRKGNHISKAGWPVVTNFSGDHVVTPVYGLGASVVRKEWLLQSLYAEVLDRHGIGDNYGVAANFPALIHVLPGAFVYHHQETANRLERPVQYFRRVIALDYFRTTKPTLGFVKKSWLLWSLTGNLFEFILVWDRVMIGAVTKAIWQIASGKNPYLIAERENRRVVHPEI